MTIRDKLMIWIYNKNNSIDSESEQLRQRIRYQSLDSLDHYEIMREKIRIAAWNEFLDDLFKIIINCK